MKNEGREFILSVKSKAPFDEFGHMVGMGPYEGDGNHATFNPEPINKEDNETARAYLTTTIDTTSKTILDKDMRSSGTTDLSTGAYAEAKVPGDIKYNKETNEVSFDYHASNPLVTTAPDIDVEGALKFTNEANGNLHVEGKVYGDGFPATGASLRFGEHGVMLGSSPIKAGTDKDFGPIQLFDFDLPLVQEEIMNINLSIGFEGKTPISVTDIENNQTYSVESWNAIHAGKPMVDCLENVDNHVTTSSVKECITDTMQFNPSENTKEVLFVSDKGIMIGGDYTKNIEDIQIKEIEQSYELDTSLKAQEIVNDMNLPQYDSSMDYGMEID